MRSCEAELMDADAPDGTLLRAEFRFLRGFNSATDAAGSLAWAMERRLGATRAAAAEIVEFGAGDASTARAFVRRAHQRGWHPKYRATDRSAEVIGLAAAASVPGTDDCISLAVADLMHPSEVLGEKTADVAFASLVLHHLSDAEVVLALRSMASVARQLVVWNDLVRDRIGVVGARLSAAFTAREVRADAVRSVQRSFTMSEATSFAEAAGLQEIEVRRWRGARFVLCASPAHTPVGTLQCARPMIRADRLSISFAGKDVLRAFSMEVRAGEVVTLEGPNGAGKTTLLRLLAGATTPDDGHAWCDRVLGPVGYLPQQAGLMSELGALSNCALPARLTGATRVVANARARDWLQRLYPAVHLHAPVRTLSVGQSRRVALASVFALHPGCLLLDEPDSGLDLEGRAGLADAVIGAARRGAATVFATHEADWIERACTAAQVPFRRVALP